MQYHSSSLLTRMVTFYTHFYYHFTIRSKINYLWCDTIHFCNHSSKDLFPDQLLIGARIIIIIKTIVDLMQYFFNYFSLFFFRVPMFLYFSVSFLVPYPLFSILHILFTQNCMLPIFIRVTYRTN